jgi:hypothetical protein
MANAAMHSFGSRRGRALGLVAGLLVLGLLLSSQSSLAPAQTGKKPPADTKKPEDKKATDKTGKKPQPEPAKIVDVIVGKRGGLEQIKAINDELREKWKENKLTPSPRCSDFEFIRRASLDIIGRIAKREEIAQFLKDPPEKRRSLLIERLLDSKEYTRNWSNIWTVLLLTRSGSVDRALKVHHEQMQNWLDIQFADKNVGWDKIVTELLTATGKTNENGAVNFVLAHLGEAIPPKENPQVNGKFQMVPITSRTTKLFLGLRTQCVQCHDHPFNDDWRQSHFWGINAFFRQVDAPKGRPQRNRQGTTVQYELTDNATLNKAGNVFFERRNGLLLTTKATFLDGQKMPAKATNRRQELAKFIVKSDYFGKAYVNRMWAHFFGRGFTKEAIDDFGEHNVISYPELLDKLAKDFTTKYNHNPCDLIWWICNSEAYGLSSTANATNDKADAEPYFSRVVLKAMTPEQLFDSLMVATQALGGKTKEERSKSKEQWMSTLIVNFGDDEGNEASFNGTVIQALLMMNGKEINDAISDIKEGTLGHILKQYGTAPGNARNVMTQLYLATLNRPPTTAEFARILNPKTMALPRVQNKNAAAFYTAFYQDLFWALLNSNEFILNH